jgi:hypothetical protein
LPSLADRTGLTGSGVIRMAIGAGLLARPTALPKALGVDSVTARKVGWLGAMVGARDVAIGAGLVHAARRRTDPRPWLMAALAADAADCLAFTVALVRRDVRPAGGATCVVAAGSGVAMGLRTLSELD